MMEEALSSSTAGNVAEAGNSVQVCVLELKIKRSPWGFVVSQLIPCILIVFGGLSAMWLDPSVPPMMGGRVALMITAMLVVVNMAGRVKLRLPTPMWLDAFNIVQLCLLMIALIVTLYVHICNRFGNKMRAMAVDQTVRLIASWAYLGYMTAVVLFGMTQSVGLWLGLSAATTILVVCVVLWNVRRIITQRRERHFHLMDALRTADARQRRSTRLRAAA